MIQEPYKNENDYRQMRRLLIENQGHPQISPYPHAGDLDFRRYLENSPEDIKKIQLWKTDKGDLAAFYWPDDHDPLLVSSYQHKEIETDILDWAEEQFRLSRIDAYDRDIQRIKLLKKKGYEKTKFHCRYKIKSLDDSIPPVRPVKGYVIRSLMKRDIRERADLHSLAAGGRRVTEKQYPALINNAPTYCGNLDLVCLTPGGEIAAFCTCWLGPGRGLFEPYGCAPKHRRKGLASALLLEGMHRLKTAGAREAVVARGGCDSEDSDPALELTAKLGFIPFGRDDVWKRPIPDS